MRRLDRLLFCGLCLELVIACGSVAPVKAAEVRAHNVLLLPLVPGDVKPDDVKPGDVKPDDVKPDDVKPFPDYDKELRAAVDAAMLRRVTCIAKDAAAPPVDLHCPQGPDGESCVARIPKACWSSGPQILHVLGGVVWNLGELGWAARLWKVHLPDQSREQSGPGLTQWTDRFAPDEVALRSQIAEATRTLLDDEFSVRSPTIEFAPSPSSYRQFCDPAALLPGSAPWSSALLPPGSAPRISVVVTAKDKDSQSEANALREILRKEAATRVELMKNATKRPLWTLLVQKFAQVPDTKSAQRLYLRRILTPEVPAGDARVSTAMEAYQQFVKPRIDAAARCSKISAAGGALNQGTLSALSANAYEIPEWRSPQAKGPKDPKDSACAPWLAPAVTYDDCGPLVPVGAYCKQISTKTPDLILSPDNRLLRGLLWGGAATTSTVALVLGVLDWSGQGKCTFPDTALPPGPAGCVYRNAAWTALGVATLGLGIAIPLEVARSRSEGEAHRKARAAAKAREAKGP